MLEGAGSSAGARVFSKMEKVQLSTTFWKKKMLGLDLNLNLEIKLK